MKRPGLSDYNILKIVEFLCKRYVLILGEYHGSSKEENFQISQRHAQISLVAYSREYGYLPELW